MAQQGKDNTGFSQRNRLWIALAAAALAVIVLAAFVSRRRDVPVRAERVVRSTITAAIATNGKIEPINNFEAHAPAPATVKRVLVQEGDAVKPGQLLLSLDDADARAQAARAQAQIKSAQAELDAVRSGGTQEEVLTTRSDLTKAQAERDSAQRNLEAMKRLLKDGAASAAEVRAAEDRLKTVQAQVTLLEQKLSSRYSGSQVAQAQARLAEAHAAYDAAQALLRDSNIRAPRAGAVYSLPVRQGNFVNAGDLLVQVADLSQVQVRAFVDEPDIGRLAVGQQVTVTWDALPGRTWDGTVRDLPTTIVARGTRNVGVITCVVNNQDRKLLPNINVQVRVRTAQHDNALTVPREAVHQEDGRRFVYQIVKGELVKQYVDISISNLTRTEVTRGLPENAEVAIASLSDQPLREGLAVRPVAP
jgi:HlyD family secretion protein